MIDLKLSSQPLQSLETLNALDEPSRQLHYRLTEVITQSIVGQGGAIRFDEYMRKALYEPGLGYYANTLVKFGPQGDFITAPEISPLFAKCVARAIAPVFVELRDRGMKPALIELGPGTGQLACDLIPALEALGVQPEYYGLYERSATLRARQQEALLAQSTTPLVWLDEMPANFCGVVLGNEILDAQAVRRFYYTGGKVEELGVCVTQEGFGWTLLTPEEDFQAYVLSLACAQEWPDKIPYLSEVFWEPDRWLAPFNRGLASGLMLFIDYGYVRKEYYHADRQQGTLMCHFRHRAQDSPLNLVGLQDISAFVDFSAIAAAARDAGMQIAGFTTQAHFMLASGLEAELQSCIQDLKLYLRTSQEAKRLLLPGEMGERFKVIALTRDLKTRPLGFDFRNFSDRL